MKISAQILLLLALFSLLSLTFSTKVTVTKSFHTSKSYHSSGNSNGNGGGSSGSEGSDNEEETPTETPPINPGADSFNPCDPNNRPEVCTLEYAPVCGYIHECEGGSCTSTFGNGCSACGNSNVDGYVNGACEDVQTTCDPDNRPEVCPDIYTATCAIASNCRGSHCFQDTSSSCVACGMEGVAYSLPGVCPGNDDDDDSDREYCDASNRPEVCTADYTPVCAHRSNCVGEDCWSTAGNACSACANENVDYWYPGECSDDDDDNEEEEDNGRTYCDSDNRPEICTLEYNPVCAHTSGCTGDNCWNTAGNACGACSDPNVDYHVPGECPNDDNDDDTEEEGDNEGDDDGDDNGRTKCNVNNRPEICTLEYAPVCAHIIGCEGDGDECFRTEGNGCGACSLDDVDHYTQGEC